MCIKVHSNGTFFTECDSIFIRRIEWVVWMSMIIMFLQFLNGI